MKIKEKELTIKAIIFFFGMLMILILTLCYWWPELTGPSRAEINQRKITALEHRANRLEQKYAHVKLAILEEM